MLDLFTLLQIFVSVLLLAALVFGVFFAMKKSQEVCCPECHYQGQPNKKYKRNWAVFIIWIIMMIASPFIFQHLCGDSGESCSKTTEVVFTMSPFIVAVIYEAITGGYRYTCPECNHFFYKKWS